MSRAGFGAGAYFHSSYTVLKGNSDILKNKVTSPYNFVSNPRLRKFCFGVSIVETCCRLTRQGGRSERDKLDRRRSTKLTIAPTLDHCSLSQVIVKLRLQHDTLARVNFRGVVGRGRGGWRPPLLTGGRVPHSPSLFWTEIRAKVSPLLQLVTY